MRPKSLPALLVLAPEFAFKLLALGLALALALAAPAPLRMLAPPSALSPLATAAAAADTAAPDGLVVPPAGTIKLLSGPTSSTGVKSIKTASPARNSGFSSDFRKVRPSTVLPL